MKPQEAAATSRYMSWELNRRNVVSSWAALRFGNPDGVILGRAKREPGISCHNLEIAGSMLTHRP
jgi:hypothetical protein